MNIATNRIETKGKVYFPLHRYVYSPAYGNCKIKALSSVVIYRQNIYIVDFTVGGFTELFALYFLP